MSEIKALMVVASWNDSFADSKSKPEIFKFVRIRHFRQIFRPGVRFERTDDLTRQLKKFLGRYSC